MSDNVSNVSKYEKIKQHLNTNKKVYLVGTTAFIVGGLVFRGGPELKQIIGSFNYKSITTNIITTELERRGHPGFKTLNRRTGEPAASINRMAKN